MPGQTAGGVGVGVGFIAFPAGADETCRDEMRAAVRACARAAGVSLADICAWSTPGTHELVALEAVVTFHAAHTVVTAAPVIGALLAVAQRLDLRVVVLPIQRRPGGDGPVSQGSGWVGQLMFPLQNGRRWRVHTVEMDVQPEAVSLAIEGEVLARIGRQRFRGWLANPVGQLVEDQVTWSVHHGVTVCVLAGSVELIVPQDVVQRLLAVV